MFKDLPEKMHDDCCSLCGAELDNGFSPWSICFDPFFDRNLWGGDSHEYRALLCQECAEKLLGQNAKVVMQAHASDLAAQQEIES